MLQDGLIVLIIVIGVGAKIAILKVMFDSRRRN
ncbi:hypothetical protein BH20ACT17_BH20ACT17_10340 [soil metagenome]|jgi:hypothetical protein